MCCSMGFLQSVLLKWLLVWHDSFTTWKSIVTSDGQAQGGRLVGSWGLFSGHGPHVGPLPSRPFRTSPHSTSWKWEETGGSGLNGIWCESVWRPQTSQPPKTFLSLPLCVHWGSLLWVGDYWSLKLKGQMFAWSHPPSPFISLPPTLPTSI